MALSYEWTPEEQREYALAKLFKYIRDYVYPYHPHYRKLFKENKIDPDRLHTYDDFRKIPVTTKEDTAADQKAFILQPKLEGSTYDIEELSRSKELGYVWKTLTNRYLRDVYGQPRSFMDRVKQTAAGEWNPVHYHMSGGTTGLPSMATYTYHDLKNVVPNIASMLYLFGWEPTMRALNMFPALPHLAFFQVCFAEFMVDNGLSMFHTCGGKAIPTEKQVVIAGMLPFDMYIAIPSYMTYWLKTAAKLIEMGVPKPEPIKYAVLAAEPLSDEYRGRLKEQFEAIGSPDVKIIEGYGSTELRAAFFECGEKTMMHLNPEFYFWEVLDPESREPVKNWGDPGVLCFSHIDWRGTVFLRYWMGDLIQGGVVWEKCSHCGLTLPILRPPIGRATRDFTKIKGARVPLMNFQNAIRRVEGVDSFQVIITKEDEADVASRDRVIVYVSLKEDADADIAKASITKQVKIDTEISPDEINVEQPEKIEQRLFEKTGLKAEWVVDNRPLHV